MANLGADLPHGNVQTTLNVGEGAEPLTGGVVRPPGMPVRAALPKEASARPRLRQGAVSRTYACRMILAISALLCLEVVAGWLIWRRLLKPLVHGVTEIRDSLPMLCQLNSLMADVADQLRLESGTNVLDVVRRLAVAAIASDRADAVESVLAGIDRIECGAEVVAADLQAAHDRADAADGVPGTAADAALRRAPDDPTS